MASDLSTYLGNKIVRWLAAQAMPSAPAALYLALYNGDPKAGGTDVTTTIATGGRIAAAFTAPASGTTNTMASTADADFGAAAGGATVTHVAVFDAASGGNMLASKSVGSNVVSAGQDVKFSAGNLVFTIGS
jgi:hypothetical protein